LRSERFKISWFRHSERSGGCNAVAGCGEARLSSPWHTSQAGSQQVSISLDTTKENGGIGMKVHLKQIPPQGLHLQGEEDCPIQELASEEIRSAGPLRYDIDVGVADGGLWANGSLSQPVELRCVSCLQRFAHEIRVHAFAVHTELHGPETIDLTPFVREDILLNLPAHPHCDRDGGRVCKTRQVSTADQNEKQTSDWSALDKLKLNH
jgi:DUF177 domain-containing protein